MREAAGAVGCALGGPAKRVPDRTCSQKLTLTTCFQDMSPTATRQQNVSTFGHFIDTFGSTPSVLRPERRVVGHLAARYLAGESQGHEVLGGHAGVVQALMHREAPAAVVGGLAEHHAALSAQGFEAGQAFGHQAAADARA